MFISTQNFDKVPRYFIPEYGNYYHFLTETGMGLYRVLSKHDQLKDKKCHFCYKGKYAKIIQLFSSYQVQIVENWAEISPDTMVVPHFRPNALKDWINLLPLRDFIESLLEPKPDARGVTVINRINNRCYVEHDELVKRLHKFGMPVREATLELLPFEDQVNLMRNTQILIGPHGSGFTNLIFLPQGSFVVELYPKGFFNRVFGTMTQAFGHHYLELESPNPSVLSRQPSERVREFFQSKGWPSRKDFEMWRPDSMEMGRVLRDVASFSLNPDAVIARLEKLLLEHP